MKDHRFIELVNLYIDRQISAAETADLEAEIQANPRRRAIYHQYCQINRAATLVYESFRTDAPGQENVLAKGKATIARIQHSGHQPRARWAYYAGGLAAACVALVLVRLGSTSSTSPGLPVAALKPVPANGAAVSPATQQPITAPRVGPATPAALVSLQPGRLEAEQDYAAMLRALRLEEQRAFANGAMQPNRTPSLFDDGVFETQQGFPAANQRVFRSKLAPAQQAEFTAFQFQR